MRLLNAESQELKTFYGQVPEYAILSHTWGRDEITLRDLGEINSYYPKNPLEVDYLRSTQSFMKITQCCKQAIKDNLQWVWIDTCCIDKTDSVELSEAINSMYQWYEESQVCYAFLADVPDDEPIEDKDSKFRMSRWFTRGWTLQELLAPSKVIFYGQGWKTLGDRESLIEIISATTKIPVRCLSSKRYRGEACIAQKMSWASTRETTRTEDIAYCLLGLFGVNMPLLYGEGEKAFLRLQEELVRTKPDDSMLIWWCLGGIRCSFGGFAPSPKGFLECGDVVCYGPSTLTLASPGIQLESSWTRVGIGLLSLNCGLPHKPNHRFNLPVYENTDFGLNNIVSRAYSRPDFSPREANIGSRKGKFIITAGPENHAHFPNPNIKLELRRTYGIRPCRIKIAVRLSPVTWHCRFAHPDKGWRVEAPISPDDAPFAVLEGEKTGWSYLLFESNGGLNHPPLRFILRVTHKSPPLRLFPYLSRFSVDFTVLSDTGPVWGEDAPRIINLDALVWASRGNLADNISVSCKRRMGFHPVPLEELFQLQTMCGSQRESLNTVLHYLKLRFFPLGFRFLLP
ncbi:hypothetical protein O1611_g2384 [Lasiodiplodia mahajangana]|uniref:Uncharacterized protein n=1 Tax=Lasiodiplodia mahajangana TaxID=1108764 RepID=A0ACC2JUN4_9PEZI|nr:hypothetical protein O1611_g2384 [Lasiodiplodia mahajangana]